MLPPGTVQIRQLELDPGAERLAHLDRLLSAGERARRDRLAFPWSRRRFTASQGALRELLGAALGVAPGALVLELGPGGKPYVAHPPGRALHFNLSHSEDRALVALARDREVGIDLEWTGRRTPHEALARRYFAPAEIEALARLPEGDRKAGFFRVWTRKEAFVKLLGAGLHFPLRAFEISVDPDRAELLALRHEGMSVSEFSLHHLEPGDGFVGALAVRGEVTVVS